MSQDQTTDIFSKVSNDERLRLFKDLATVRGDLSCKGDRDEIYHLTVERTHGNMELRCSIPFGLTKPSHEKELFGNFYIGGERYFFKTPVRMDGEIAVLRMDVELFHLQRRQNYRIRIPESYQAYLLISSHNKLKAKFNAQLCDLSTGGCRVALNAATPNIEIGDRLEGQIHIDKKEALDIEGTVRHIKIEKGQGTTKQIFGVEFKPLSPLTEGKLFSITMDLHREFFSKLNKNS